MADPFTQLQAQIDRIRALKKAPEVIAREGAREIKRELAAGIAQGQSPNGKPLKPTKDGRQPLRNAAKAITTSARGTVILVRVDGVEARHHIGAVRGGKGGSLRRPLIPTTGTVAPVERALERVATQAFERTMGES